MTTSQNAAKANSADIEAGFHHLESRLKEEEQDNKRLTDILIALLKRGPDHYTFTEDELAADDGRKLMTHYRGDGTVKVSLHRWQNEPR